jgi:hypothetical protein
MAWKRWPAAMAVGGAQIENRFPFATTAHPVLLLPPEEDDPEREADRLDEETAPSELAEVPVAEPAALLPWPDVAPLAPVPECAEEPSCPDDETTPPEDDVAFWSDARLDGAHAAPCNIRPIPSSHCLRIY